LSSQFRLPGRCSPSVTNGRLRVCCYRDVRRHARSQIIRRLEADPTKPSLSSSPSTSSIVTGRLVRESTICWTHAHTAWASRPMTSRTKSSGDFALMPHAANFPFGEMPPVPGHDELRVHLDGGSEHMAVIGVGKIQDIGHK